MSAAALHPGGAMDWGRPPTAPVRHRRLNAARGKRWRRSTTRGDFGQRTRSLPVQAISWGGRPFASQAVGIRRPHRKNIGMALMNNDRRSFGAQGGRHRGAAYGVEGDQRCRVWHS